MKKYIGIDIGGTAIKYGILDENGQILQHGQRKTEAYRGGEAIMEKALDIVRMYGISETVSGICISTAGIVEVNRGEIIHAAPLIPRYQGICFKKTMEQEFGIPCEVENDVNCAGLAEAVSGASKGSRVSLMLTVGTGIGGCIVIDGQVFRGFGNSACEIGYMNMSGSDFQTLGAASVLSKKVAEWKNGTTAVWNGYRIFKEAEKGDELCIRAIDEMIEVLGQGIANICYVINPEVVVLGGGIMSQEEYLKDKIGGAVERYLIPYIASQTRIAFAKYKNHAGMLGAFYHFQHMRAGKDKGAVTQI